MRFLLCSTDHISDLVVSLLVQNCILDVDPDSREKVLEFNGQGITMREAADVFGIALDTANNWLRYLRTSATILKEG